jgi:endoglucanase
MDSRIRWTEFVRSEAERHGFAWAYWEFASGFGVYDPNAKVWRDGLLQALIP